MSVSLFALDFVNLVGSARNSRRGSRIKRHKREISTNNLTFFCTLAIENWGRYQSSFALLLNCQTNHIYRLNSLVIPIYLSPPVLICARRNKCKHIISPSNHLKGSPKLRPPSGCRRLEKITYERQSVIMIAKRLYPLINGSNNCCSCFCNYS